VESGRRDGVVTVAADLAPAAPPGGAGAGILLEARDLVVTPPGSSTPAFPALSLAVRAGEWVALSGPNGGGKTSLILALAGLWPASGGTLALDGRPFGPGPRDARASGVAVALQDPSSQLLAATVGEELAFAARNLGLPEPEIARSIAAWSTAFGLDAELGLAPVSLSAGRQQLVVLAAALVARPRLLLADEPTAHVDLAGRTRVRDAIARAVGEGLAVVWATQDPAEHAAATRQVTVGHQSPVPQPPARTPEARPDRVALRLRVATPAGDDGPRVRVRDPLDVEIGERGVVALLGANGAGKSVLLAAAAGLEALEQVTVEWGSPPALPPIMALQYPELQVFEELVSRELVFAARSRGVSEPAAREAARAHLIALGLDADAFLDRRTWTLSTGEKRLVEVVGALIAPACLVLLDEPTAGLDLARREALAGLVLERARRVPVLVATQDLEWAASLGARPWTIDG
jgi:energy-coupling factor transport system ATP-binding protein